MFNTKYYIKKYIYTISCYLLSFLLNLKLKTELLWLRSIAAEFGVMRLLYYHKGILTISLAEFSFQKLQYV